jgi:acetylornithine deacetylase/succinyl-diaminopimelate desuccinylase-like protein
MCIIMQQERAVGCGAGYQGSLVHAPNENVRMADYWGAMRCMGAFIEAFAEARLF